MEIDHGFQMYNVWRENLVNMIITKNIKINSLAIFISLLAQNIAIA